MNCSPDAAATAKASLLPPARTCVEKKKKILDYLVHLNIVRKKRKTL
jgi:hypothetical protein